MAEGEAKYEGALSDPFADSMPADPPLGPAPSPQSPRAAQPARAPIAPHAANARPPGEPLPTEQELLAGLTPSQRQAVLTTEGPLLVLAGPGSGKTRVITRRIAHLLHLGVKPWRILALTFTNKAAGEMRNRVAALLGGPESAAMRGLTITTFHALCVRLLRRYAEASGLAERGVLKADFSVYDADDQSRLMKRVIADLQLSTSNFPPRNVLSAVSAAKNELIGAQEFGQRAQDFYGRNVAKCYAAYQAGLRAANACDFDDLLMLAAKMLRESAPVRAELQLRYRYLLIDEYQDTNRAQFVIASMLAGEKSDGAANAAIAPAPGARDVFGRPLALGVNASMGTGGQNICAVGDPDQSIYGWRGADISNILQFEEHFPRAKVIALGENFRSRAPILSVADRLIKKNAKRKNKPLISTRGEGDKIEMVLCRDEHHEARIVADWIAERLAPAEGGAGAGEQRTAAAAHAALLGADGRPLFHYKDFAVFYRTNALSRVMEDELRTRGVPYTIVRGTAFFDREEVRNAIAYLRLLANPADNVSLERIVNTPARGIGDTTYEKFAAVAAQTGAPVLGALRAPGAVPGLQPRAVAAVGRFTAMLDGWSGDARPATDDFLGSTVERGVVFGSLPALVERVIRESGLEASYKTPGDEERLENLAELISSAKDFEDTLIVDADVDPETGEARVDAEGRTASQQLALMDKLRAYLERVALVADSDALDPTRGAVTLMTLHAAKGLEYPCVAMIGLEEGCLPHARAQESEKDLEEERRLCFVGVTRAMERLLICSATFRTIRGMAERTIPSRFLTELNGPEVLISDQSDPLGGASDDHEMHAFLSRGARGGGGGDRGSYGSRAGFGGQARSGAGARDEFAQESFDDVAQTQSRPARGAPGVVRSGLGGAGNGAAALRGGAGGDWSAGTRVRHPQFGVGEVTGYSPGATPRVSVKFAGNVGTKTLVLEYARLTRL
ncbi:3'-5' exonuclease [soil metagenome]